MIRFVVTDSYKSILWKGRNSVNVWCSNGNLTEVAPKAGY